MANQANPGGCDECQTERTCSTTCDYTSVGRKWKARQKFFFEGGDSITSRLSASYNGLNNEEATDYRKGSFYSSVRGILPLVPEEDLVATNFQ